MSNNDAVFQKYMENSARLAQQQYQQMQQREPVQLDSAQQQLPPVQAPTFESDTKVTYSPVPDGLKTSNQDTLAYMRQQRDQKLFVDLAVDAAQQSSPTRSESAAMLRATMQQSNAPGLAGYVPLHVNAPKNVMLDKTGKRAEQSEPKKPLLVPGIGPDCVPRAQRWDADGNLVDDGGMGTVKTDDVEELKAEIRELRYQVRMLVAKLPSAE
jgi:hypothetical protein